MNQPNGGGDHEHEHDSDLAQDGEQQRGRGRGQLAPPLQIPKNRSTGNLAVVSELPEAPEASRLRFSYDAASAVAEYDSITRSPVMTKHDHGPSLSGLRRIRQSQPSRAPTLPSTAASSRRPSASFARTASMATILSPSTQGPMSAGPSSPKFSEDLSRFPCESLHSFSFAHQSEDFLRNRQNVLKRSIEFMKDRTGWTVSSNAAIASAQARVTGDVEMQNMLDLLAKAQLVGAGNLPNPDPSLASGPLTGPAGSPGDNVFEKQFVHRANSPGPYASPEVSPTTVKTPPGSFGPVTQRPASLDERPVSRQLGVLREQPDSEQTSRTTTNDSSTTDQTSPPPTRRPTLKRTFTDTISASRQQKLMDAMAQPFLADQLAGSPDQLISPTTLSPSSCPQFPGTGALGSAVHLHSTRWAPAAQAIFTSESKPPWTILAANDLACLVFGVTKAEVRKMGILEVVQEERRSWLERKLLSGRSDDGNPITSANEKPKATPVSTGSAFLGGRGGITAQLLSKPNSRSQPPTRPQASERRAQTVHSGDANPPRLRGERGGARCRGVLLCGDVVPIRKRNGATGAASLWVKEKSVGLIWVLEEIHEDVVFLGLDEDGVVTKINGETGPIWGQGRLQPGMDVGKLISRIPRQGVDPRYGAVDYAQIAKRKFFTCRNSGNINIPATVTQTPGQTELRVSSYPHIAGIVVLDPSSLDIKSSNAVFCGALFGYEKPDGLSINILLPDFDKILNILTDHEGVPMEDGIVVPEHSFRKAAAFLAFHQGRREEAPAFLNPEGLPAKHRDGAELRIDVQMRVVESERRARDESNASSDEASAPDEAVSGDESEMVYALWITYSRHLHTAARPVLAVASPISLGTATPLRQPSPGQTPAHTPPEVGSESDEPKKEGPPPAKLGLAHQIKGVAVSAAARLAGVAKPREKSQQPPATEAPEVVEPPGKKTIDDFTIVEDMGQGAYGQVKLARYKHGGGRKVVLKYVTKRRILVDTWTRDRRLGTVPLEIHVLDYLRRDGLKHPNIVEMVDFFEDDTNYYIEMAPHGLPGMDLFDYIELRTSAEEDECRSIFVQVAKAIEHLHCKAKVVHRDIKDENVILDGEGKIKLIDFGSAAYIKSGPFDVFVGTIDYAAPEVLAGRPYGGKEQDVWALGILLYTIIYKENPFYSIDEIMDRDLRVPYTISDESIDLIRRMLDRDVSKRYDISQVLEHPWCKSRAE